MESKDSIPGVTEGMNQVRWKENTVHIMPYAVQGSSGIAVWEAEERVARRTRPALAGLLRTLQMTANIED